MKRVLEIRPISGAPGYGVSDDGRVWSRWICRQARLGEEWREVAQKTKKNAGYKIVNIGPYGKQKSYLVHRLVASAFIGAIPHNFHVDHLDCDKANNHASNLEIVSREENEMRAFINGRKLKGSAHGMAKYTEDQISNVKTAFSTGAFTRKELAKKYSVGYQTVCAVISEKQWSHV